jgi:hypothetical protein
MTSLRKELQHELTPWMWMDQEAQRENWPTITNIQGTEIYIAPRRYVVQWNLKRGMKAIQSAQDPIISHLKPSITSIHNYKKAPEPLSSLDSHFQILGVNNGKTLYVSLTNISSQTIRKEIFKYTFRALENDYNCKTLWIQMGADDQPHLAYTTEREDILLKCIGLAREKILEHKIMTPTNPPWTYRAQILLTHLAQNRSQAILPERLQQLEKRNQRQEEKQKEIQHKEQTFWKQRKPTHLRIQTNALTATEQLSPSPSPELTTEQLQKIDQEVKEATTHLLSTKTTSKRTGNQESTPIPAKRHHSSHSTTGTTSISSSPRAQMEETQQDNEPASPSSLVVKAKELQKLLFITFSRIRLLRRFLLYCLRYGIQTTHIYGIKQQTDLQEINKEFQLLFQHHDPNDVIKDAKCEQYIEENKERTTKRMGNQKSKHLADIIIDKIKECNITSAQDWENVIPPEFKPQLIKEFGLSVDSYIQKIVRIVKQDRTMEIKTKTLTEILLKHLNENLVEHMIPGEINYTFNQATKWIEDLFILNNINMIEFLAWNEIIKTQRYMKVNSMVLEGYTNAGKSLIIDNLIGLCQPEEIPRERDNSGFHLDQLPSASCVLFEEPIITPTNVGTWKLLLEGKVVKTDIKHKDKEGIKRLPIWITTATPITNNIDNNESIQIQQRIKLILFKKCIQHRTDSHTLNTELQRRLIPKAPTHILPVHFAFLWCWNWKKIYTKIQELDTQHIMNKDHLPITKQTRKTDSEWQTQLRTSWNRTTMENQQENEEKELLDKVEQELAKEMEDTVTEILELRKDMETSDQ